MSCLNSERNIREETVKYYTFYPYILGEYSDEFYKYAKNEIGVFADILFHIFEFEVKFINEACTNNELLGNSNIIDSAKTTISNRDLSNWSGTITVSLYLNSTIILSDEQSGIELELCYDDLYEEYGERFIRNVLKYCKLSKKDKQMFILFRLLSDLVSDSVSAEDCIDTCKNFIDNLEKSLTSLFNLVITATTFDIPDLDKKIGNDRLITLSKRSDSYGMFRILLAPRCKDVWTDCLSVRNGKLVYIVCGGTLALLTDDILTVVKGNSVIKTDYKEYMQGIDTDKGLKRKILLSGIQVDDVDIIIYDI